MGQFNFKYQPVYQRLLTRVSLLGLISLGTACASASSDNFSGVWVPDKPGKEIKTSSGEMPPLNPEGLEIYNINRAAAARDDLSFDLVSTKCAMPGLTRMHYLPYPIQIFQNDLRVSFIYEFNHNFRSVSIMSDPGEAAWETAYGLGGAQFIGDNMVINTSGLIDETHLDSLGMPHSNFIKIKETFTLSKGGDQLNVVLGFEDPAIFTEAWETKVTYHRADNLNLQEDICLDRTSLGNPAIDWNRQ